MELAILRVRFPLLPHHILALRPAGGLVLGMRCGGPVMVVVRGGGGGGVAWMQLGPVSRISQWKELFPTT